MDMEAVAAAAVDMVATGDGTNTISFFKKENLSD